PRPSLRPRAPPSATLFPTRRSSDLEGGNAMSGHGKASCASVRSMGPRLATIRTCLKSLDPPGVPQPREHRQFPVPARRPVCGPWLGSLLLALLVLACAGVQAQARRDPGTAERELRKVRAELQQIGRERRKLEGQRGEAAQRLRSADEQLGRSARELAETEEALQRETRALAELEQRRDVLERQQAQGRERLADLLRASY